MNNQDKKIPTTCGLSTLQRPYYNTGQLLDDDDLNAGVTYTQDLTRLLFRSLFGCGVICGLQVSAQWACGKTKWSITVTKGLALDCQGNPIELPADATMQYGSECQELPPALWVVICYIQKCCRPKDVTCSQDDSAQPKPTRVRAGYEIRLYESLPKCACHCPTDYDIPAPPPNEECCEDAPQPAGETGTSPSRTDSTSADTICPCFRSHFKGDCECGCNCECVILARIAVKEEAPTPDTTMVRRIRPLLNGYVDCGSLSFTEKKRGYGRDRGGERRREVVDLLAAAEEERLRSERASADIDEES